MRGRAKARIGPRRDLVGDQHLLREPDDQERQTHPEVRCVEALVRRGGELRHHLAMMEDGSRQQVREEADEEAVVDERRFAHEALAGVDQISDLGESKEADAKGKNDMRQQPVRTEHDVRVGNKEVGVLEITQQRQIGDHAGRQQRARRDGRQRRHRRAGTLPGSRHALQRGADDEIEDDAPQEQRHETPAPPAIEEQRRDEQPQNARASRPPAVQREINEAGRGQEREQECV